MLYWALASLKSHYRFFNVFHYITFRAALATLTAFFLALIFGPWLIRKLRNSYHPNVVDFHKSKVATPTMGGLLILGSLFISMLCWADLSNVYIWMLLLCCLWLGALGFYDDYIKLTSQSGKGVRPLVKIAGQVVLGFLIGLFLYYNSWLHFNLDVAIPFFKKIVWDLGPYYILLVIFIIVGTSNAVNLTDGLDGLAIGSVLMVAIAYSVISYLVGHYQFANYLNISFVPGAGEVTVFAAGLIGASLGFLWFNSYPAEIFMGDTGALALGGVVGLMAIIVKQEISLVIVGGIFVLEALSVIIQVISYQGFGRRVFAMTPLHHHFELKGWSETKVVIRFWIMAIILVLFTLATLKVR